jgi:hypothetical protein
MWRGVPNDISDQFKNGQVVTWWSISSCSQSLHVIKDFLDSGSNSTLLMIEAINARDVSSYSYYPNEDEVLLGLGTELRMKGGTLQHHGGLNIIQLVQLRDDDDEELPSAVNKIDLNPKIPVEGAIGKFSLHSVTKKNIKLEIKFELLVKYKYSKLVIFLTIINKIILEIFRKNALIFFIIQGIKTPSAVSTTKKKSNYGKFNQTSSAHPTNSPTLF